MGYTHYIYVKVATPPEKLAEVVPDLVKLIEATDVPLADGMGTPGTEPRIEEGYVAFNGVGDQAHETFHFPPPLTGEYAYRTDSQPDSVFDFCKTARKPYDAVVVACLLRIEAVIGRPWVKVSTDASDIGEYMSNEMSEGWADVNRMLNSPAELLEGLGLGDGEIIHSGGDSNPTENVLEETAAQLYARVFNEPPPIPACFREEVEA